MAKMMSRTLVRIALVPLIIHHGANALTVRSPLHMTSGKQSPMPVPRSTVLATTTSAPPLEDASRSSKQPNSNSNRQKRKKPFRQNGRTKSKGAPMVDSTLLRFLSAQKNEMAKRSVISDLEQQQQQQQQPQQQQQFRADGGGDEESLQVQSSIQKISSPIKIEKVVGDDSGVDVPVGDIGTNDEQTTDDVSKALSMAVGNVLSPSSSSTLTSSIKVEGTSAESLKWFTQYNAQCVAKKLMSLGVPDETAMEAGNAVQNYSLARTTRQRVRKFLRDRDLKWASGNNSEVGAESSSNAFDEVAFKRDSYNIDDVISFLTDAGLTGIDIAAIFNHTPSVSMMKARREDVVFIDEERGITNANGSEPARKSQVETLEDTLNRAYFGVLCTTIKLRKYDARKVLRTCPGLLTKHGSSSCEEVMTIISSLGVTPTSLKRDKAALPMLLSRSPASLFRFVAFLSSDAIRMPVKNIGPFIRGSECAGILDLVAPVPRYNSLFNSGDDFADNDEDTGPMSLERLLNDGGNRKMQDEVTKTYNQMFRSARFLRKEIGIKDLGKVLVANPRLFTTNAEKKIIPVVNFLYDLGLDDDDVPRVLESYPALLEASPAQMQEVVDFVLDLEISEDVLGSIFRAFPALLVQDTETTMTEVVTFLQKIGVTNIGRFITRLPPVLGYSVEEDLVPKWNYLNSVCQFASFEVSKFPAYFAYPLDRVIKSRYEYLGKVKRFPVQLQPVDEILRYGDNDFATIVACDADGDNYAKFVKARNAAKKRKRSGGPSKNINTNKKRKAHDSKARGIRPASTSSTNE